MKNHRRHVFCIVLCLVCAGATLAAAPDVRLGNDEVWDRDISLDLKDAAVRQVLTLAFEIAEQSAFIDPCVEGSVSLKFENVSLRDALISIARMGNFRVRPMRDGYHVDCGPGEADAVKGADANLLEFTLTNLSTGEVLSDPTLLVRYDSLAEIEVGSTRQQDLDHAGDFFAAELLPTFRVKVYLARDDDVEHPGTLRGMFEIASPDPIQPRTLRMAAHAFEIDLPRGSTEVEVATLELGSELFELMVSRPHP